MGANPNNPSAQNREAELARALRENLRKRKQQAAARGERKAENEKQK